MRFDSARFRHKLINVQFYETIWCNIANEGPKRPIWIRVSPSLTKSNPTMGPVLNACRLSGEIGISRYDYDSNATARGASCIEGALSPLRKFKKGLGTQWEYR